MNNYNHPESGQMDGMEKFIFLFAFLVLIGGAISIGSNEIEKQNRSTYDMESSGGSHVDRIRDKKYRVICWQYKTSYGGGLSCLPEDQLKLREVRHGR